MPGRAIKAEREKLRRSETASSDPAVRETAKQLAPELTLDPEDWEAFRRSAHRALDDAIQFLQSARERPVWQPVPQDVRDALSDAMPREGLSLDRVYDDFTKLILPYSTGNTHPRFFGWVHGSGLAVGIIAEMMAAALNANCGGRDHGAIYVERAVIDWFKQLFDMPPESTGLLVSGTSMANLIALTVARNAVDMQATRAKGLQANGRHLVAYASEEAHECIIKAMEILGLGAAQLRRIPVDDNFRMDVASLRRAIGEDRNAGLEPFCVVGTAGTVNTAAIDNLEEIARLCHEEHLWFHVDGAFGALALVSAELKPRLAGIERADSIAFDFHKWMHVPYDAGCILVRRGDLHRASFSMRPPYLNQLRRGLGGGSNWPCEFGPELSRGFRALKVWFAVKHHGVTKFGRLIEQNCAQARYLEQAITREPELELMAPVSLNIVCFRYRANKNDGQELDLLNEAIVEDLQEAGIAAPSTTTIRGNLVIRVNITNHRCRQDDFDLLLSRVLEFAHRRG